MIDALKYFNFEQQNTEHTENGVPYIVQPVVCSIRTSGGYFKPSKVSFGAILAVAGNSVFGKNTFFDFLSFFQHFLFNQF